MARTFVALMLLSLLAVAPLTESVVSCGIVARYLGSCIGYIKNGGIVPPPCCNGIRGLNGLARTTPDRQSACNCIKSLTRAITGARPGLAAGLPGRCGVSVPYPISPSTDCSRIR